MKKWRINNSPITTNPTPKHVDDTLRRQLRRKFDLLMNKPPSSNMTTVKRMILSWVCCSNVLRLYGFIYFCHMSKRCLVSFEIGLYKDTIWYDVFPLKVTHILLGQPWSYDNDVQYNSKANAYSFLYHGGMIILKPMNIESIKKSMLLWNRRRLNERTVVERTGC